MISEPIMLIIVAANASIVSFASGLFISRMLEPPPPPEVTPILPG